MFKKAFFVLVLAGFVLGACTSVRPTPTAAIQSTIVEPARPKLEATPRIAVMSAFDAELELLLKQAQVKTVYVINGRKFNVGSLEGKDVVMFLSGGSMSNAAMTTQQALDTFNITKLIFSGISGGVSPELHIGDVYAAAQWAEYQENFFVRQLPSGEYKPPEWFQTKEPNFGMMFPQSSSLTVKGGEPDKEKEIRWFAADPRLLAIAQAAASKVSMDKCAGSDCLRYQPIIHVGGNAVSGPTFVDNAEYRKYVYSTWQAWGLDMESAAAAHVLTNNGVPFLFVRSASDLAGGDAGPNPIMIFFKLAANNSARFLLEILKETPVQ